LAIVEEKFENTKYVVWAGLGEGKLTEREVK
jgi:hypothetical protein